MERRTKVPDFFVYGEPSRVLDASFLHVETVMERKVLHFGHVAPHRHPHMGQITWWTKGGGTYQIEDKTWTFSAPAISYVPSNVVHGFDVDERSDAIVVSIADGMLKAVAPQAALNLDVPTFLTGQENDRTWADIGRLLDMIAREYREAGGGNEKVLSGLLSVAMSLMNRLGGNAALPLTSPTVKLGLRLRALIDSHFAESWPVGRYVEMLATTRHLLDRAARETFGKSVKDLLIERRLLEAQRLLRFTIRSVEDIGREIGFHDPAYFTRFFRHRTGETPSAARARLTREENARQNNKGSRRGASRAAKPPRRAPGKRRGAASSPSR